MENVKLVYKLHEGRPNVLDEIKNENIQLLVNTPSSSEEAQSDRQMILRSALPYKLPIVTTVAGAKATAHAIRSSKPHPLEVKAIQDYIR